MGGNAHGGIRRVGIGTSPTPREVAPASAVGPGDDPRLGWEYRQGRPVERRQEAGTLFHRQIPHREQLPPQESSTSSRVRLADRTAKSSTMYEKRTSTVVTSHRFSALASAPKDEARHPRTMVLNPFTRRGGRIEPR